MFFLTVPEPEIGHVRPELKEHVIADVSGNGGSPGLKDNAEIGAGIGIIGKREGGSGEMAEDIGAIETVTAIIALNDKGAFSCPAGAAFVAAGSFAIVARIFVQDNRKEAVAEKAHAGLPNHRSAEAITKTAFVGAVVGNAGELAISGREKCRQGGLEAHFLVEPEDPFVSGVEGRDALTRVDVLGPFARFEGSMLDGAGCFWAGPARRVLRIMLNGRHLLHR